MTQQIKKLKSCKNCHKDFHGDGRYVYCSRECRVSFWNKYRKKYCHDEYYPLHKKELIEKIQQRKKD